MLPSIDVVGVTKAFGQGAGRFLALADIDLQIGHNEFFTLLGPSGCGKTTLLRLIAGFDSPTEGRIRLAGEDITPLPPFRRPVNTVFQSYALFPHMSVAQNIGFGLEMLGKPKAEIEAAIAAMLRLVQMEDLRDRRIGQISGGQQQRVALARALAPQPQVLLLDEPLSALDLKLRKEMQLELKRLQHETGITFVFVTHDQEEALAMSDRIAVMRDGRILQVGTPREIYDSPADRFVASFIGDTNLMEADVLARADRTARLRLSSGFELEVALAAAIPCSDRVTVAVRPEQALVAPQTEGADLVGRLENVVYVGTDTHNHIRLADGQAFVARMQNSGRQRQSPVIGEQVGVFLAAGAIQVLRD